MEHNNENNGFSYTYSAGEQEELKRIREKYTEKEENKLERLRRLDRSVAQKAQTVSLIVGIIGALVLGMGMSLAMTEIGAEIGMGHIASMVTGISTGIVGVILASIAYPIYNAVLKRERKKIAPEIIKLTDELMK